MSSDSLLPTLDDTTTPFWEGCKQHKLLIQRCVNSGRLIHPPRYNSPWHTTGELDWVEVSGRGKVWSVIEPHPPLTAQFAALAPYNCVIVELDEDPTVRLAGNLIASTNSAINSISFDEISIGDAVRVVFQKEEDGLVMPRWVKSET